MQKLMLGLLVCPLCKGKLTLNGGRTELHCRPDGLAFPIIDEVPVMLEGRARTLTTEERVG
ncbi:Trm112 family protein [Litorivicinus lipolyticus]|uniref:UPF0434 protein GH975_04270 n=1 Tax=Litorivicinus lipolyticus TaxID=418701 RepID=A0A5Q2QDA2_9GAMM|nr:Trm112 family protein [Litorivicinus lipolyticus]QGG79830.1 Trm112 family protein [Litorivicinus lipolyticus]